MRFFTTTLTSGTLSISAIDGAMFVSIQTDSTSGSASVLGNIPFKQVNPSAVTLGAGQGVNLSALSPASPLDGVTITWLAGSVDVVVGF
jgi:hypothetical protein